VQKDPVWKKKRQDVKPITFGEKYGAGVAKLAADSKRSADTVKEAIERRRAKYPDMYKYDDDVEDEVNRSRTVTSLRTDEGYQKAIGYYRSPTNTIFHFLEGESHDWQKEKGIFTSFQTTCMKNYPSQGLGGEIMQVQSGRVVRKIYEYDLREQIKVMNTVHDSMYFDFVNEDVAKRWLPAIGGLLEDVSIYFNRLYVDVAWDTAFPVDIDYGLNIMETNTSIKERTDEWI
jgi:DNA polymerase I-like protein with 3'-5' exonuclease and polymerase domains